MSEFVTSTMQQLGYFGVALLMVLENLFPPIPSEVVMPAAGAAARSGQHSLLGMILAGTAGTLLGALPWYAVARAAGTERLSRWVDQHGYWLGTDSEEIRKMNQWFDRYGYWAVFFCRLIPGIRTLISVPAGFAAMPLPGFLLATGLGSLAWCSLLAALGYWLTGQHQAIADVLSWIGMGVVALLVILYIVKIFRHRARTAAASGN
jgi:membrane protein DedA with SNARE-associated domain